MSEEVLKDHSIHEPTTAHIHPLETIPQGTQGDGVLNGHDQRDVDTGILAKCFLGLVALIVFSFAVTWVLTNGMLGALKKTDTVPSSSYVERADLEHAWPVKPIDTPLQSPDAMPVLQADPESPNVELREEDEAQLYNYNEAKDAQGRKVGYKIPVDRAIDLTLERGLPSDNRVQVTLPKPSGDPVAMGEISPSHKFMRDSERRKLKGDTSKGKAQVSAASQTRGVRSPKVLPSVASPAVMDTMDKTKTLDKVDADGRNLGSKRSPY